MNLMQRWRALWDPSMYHGWSKSRKYFEGWYFKLVDREGQHALAIIPGISMAPDGSRHAFIQVFDGKKNQAHYQRFDALKFQAHPRHFEVTLGTNRFTAHDIHLDLPQIKGQLQFSNLHPWPKHLHAPGIMGWYSFVPFMECYHGVLSVHHRIEGLLETPDGPVDFSGGTGYMEKDWGVSFPSSWIWVQSNHFDSDAPVSLMASVARIPWLGSSFTGFISGFLWKGKILRFASYTGARMEARLQDGSVSIVFQDKRYRLEITAYPGEGTALRSPISGEMTGKVNESLQATVQVRLYEKGSLAFSGEGRNAGLEIAGPVEEILSETR
jgi:tocopherol cyclase